MGHPLPDLIGFRHERLIVIQWVGPGSLWYVRCDCGTVKLMLGTQIRRVKSCGCLSRDILALRNHRHGEGTRKNRSPEYECWKGMVRRCSDSKADNWIYYGGRGVTVCDRWLNSFPDFLADVGRRPSPEYSLDRYPNNEGNYEPGNVRWATRDQQMKNTRAAKRGRQSGPLCRALTAFRRLSEADRKSFLTTIENGSFDLSITHRKPNDEDYAAVEDILRSRA